MADDVELLIAGGGLNGLPRHRLRRGRVADDPRRPPGPGGDAGRELRRPHLGDRLRLAAGARRRSALWPGIAADAEPIREIRVADDEFAAVPALRPPRPRPTAADPAPLGYIVENRVLRRALFERARALAEPAPAGAAPRRRDDARPTPARSRPSATAARCRARLVAAADGKDSPLRRAAGIRAVEWRYHQIGIVTTVAHERPHAGIAIEHFLPAGPFAILPMTGNRVVDRVDRERRPGAAPARAARRRIRRRTARPVRRFPRARRAGRAALGLSAVADAGRALHRPRAWRWSARRRM